LDLGGKNVFLRVGELVVLETGMGLDIEDREGDIP
jgi:hypothetical protein